MPRTPDLTAGKAFLHVCNDYRWLMYSTCWWDSVKDGGTKQLEANECLPGIGVAIQSGALQYARSLVEFYIKTNPYAPHPTARSSDIVVEDFGASVSKGTLEKLDGYKVSVEVHLLHLTAWRDTDFRAARAATPEGRKRARFDWDHEYRNITMAIVDAAKEAATGATPWSAPFERLYDASVACLGNAAEPEWPPELTEKADVAAYLHVLGLA